MTASAPSTEDLERWRRNLQGESDGIAVYRAMAAGERDPRLAALYARLAEAEERHARVWTDRLHDAGAPAILPPPSWRARVLGFVARRFGAGLVASTVASQEVADRGRYDAQPDARAAGLPGDEREHARMLREVLAKGGAAGPAIARAEGRHRGAGGNALRAAVLGVNDGLVSNLSLVMGVAGAGAGGHTVIIAGLAGLLAGSLAMAMGEWLSVQSARELYARQIAVEAEELAASPAEEEEELAIIYESKGLSAEQARTVASRIVRGDQRTALDTLAREELGIDPDELGGSAWVAAGTSFFMFASGAIVSLLPFLLSSGTSAVVASAALSAAALFGVGAAITVVTGQSALRSGARQTAIGLAAAAVTFGIGRLVGVTIG